MEFAEEIIKLSAIKLFDNKFKQVKKNKILNDTNYEIFSKSFSLKNEYFVCLINSLA